VIFSSSDPKENVTLDEYRLHDDIIDSPLYDYQVLNLDKNLLKELVSPVKWALPFAMRISLGRVLAIFLIDKIVDR